MISKFFFLIAFLYYANATYTLKASHSYSDSGCSAFLGISFNVYSPAAPCVPKSCYQYGSYYFKEVCTNDSMTYYQSNQGVLGVSTREYSDQYSCSGAIVGGSFLPYDYCRSQGTTSFRFTCPGAVPTRINYSDKYCQNVASIEPMDTCSTQNDFGNSEYYFCTSSSTSVTTNVRVMTTYSDTTCNEANAITRSLYVNTPANTDCFPSGCLYFPDSDPSTYISSCSNQTVQDLLYTYGTGGVISKNYESSTTCDETKVSSATWTKTAVCSHLFQDQYEYYGCFNGAGSVYRSLSPQCGTYTQKTDLPVGCSPSNDGSSSNQYYCQLAAVTTKYLTTKQMTTKPITTKPLSTNLPTTNKLTTNQLTTNKMTTMSLTTQKMTTQEMTTNPLTTQEFSTGALTTNKLTTKKKGSLVSDGVSIFQVPFALIVVTISMYLLF